MRAIRLPVCGALRCCSVVLGLAMVSDAAAQSQSLFGNRGPIGQQSAQRGGTGTSGFGNTGGGLGTGSGFGNTGGLGTGGLGSGGAGQQGAGALGNVQGFTGGFVGRSDNANRFVGQQQAAQGLQSTPLGGANRLGGGVRQRGNANALNDPNNPLGGGGGFGGTQGRRQAYVVRPQQRIAFEYPARSASEVGTSVRTQMSQVSTRRQTLRDVQVSTDSNGVVTLRGQVASEESRKLAAAMARLEPGVREVKNELTVGGGAR